MNRVRLFKVCLLTISGILVSSCTQPTPGRPTRPPAVQPWTGMFENVNAVWSAEPGIDLVTGPAVVVRAYMESYFLALAMGTTDVLYPGFSDAVPRPTEQPGQPWPDTETPLPNPLVGTDREHILRIDSRGRDVTAIVCYYGLYMMGNDLGDGKYGRVPGSQDDGVAAIQLAMTAPESPSPPLPPQQGPERAPAADVFGGWRIDSRRANGVRSTTEWPTMEADIEACRDRAPDPLQRRQFLRQGEHPRSDYPTLPAYPGWPAAAGS